MRKAKRLSILTAAFAALAILSGCVVMGPQTTIPQGAYEPSVGGWEMTPEGRTMRASSADANWEDGNGDARAIAPGETLTIAELEGPGRINHIWFTMMSASIVHPRTTTLRIYWDGDEEPSVEAPVGDFFAVGHGVQVPVNSAPVQVSSEGRAYNCFWPMPFGRSARVTVTNDGDKDNVVLFWYVDWQKLDSLPANVPYFHAQYRQEMPCTMGEDYLLLDTVGRGHYVGTVLSVRMRQPSWFGEGDDRFFIDGETEPSLRGTGTEDYFSDAWGFREFNAPYHGVTLWEGYETGDRGTAYRWHLKDPVSFEESLRVTIEHKGAVLDPETRQMTSGFQERDDEFSSVAFWYQTGKAKRFATIPPGSERVPPMEVVEIESSLDAENLPPLVQLQASGMWSGPGGNVLFANLDPEGEIEYPFTVEEAGRYLVALRATHSWDYGIYDVHLDGELVKERYDFQSETCSVKDVRFGIRTLEAGEHSLRFVCRGANKASEIKGSGQTGYYLGVDCMNLYPFD